MMNRFFQFCFLFSLLICNALSAKAQDFPATKKQVIDWLTATEWKIKTLIVDGRKLNAEDINMKASIRFAKDSTYTMIFMSEHRQGNYEIDMDGKWIILHNKELSKEILIRNLKIKEFEAKSLGEDEGELIMIFVSLN